MAAATSLIQRYASLPTSLTLPGVGNSMGVPGDPPVQPGFLGSRATPMHASWGGSEIEVDPVINIALNLQETEEHKDLDVDIGKDELTFIAHDQKMSKELAHITCYAKSLSKLNLMLKSTEGRTKYPTCSGAAISRDWRLFGVKESITQGPGAHNFHICKRARIADIWAWDNQPRRDGAFLWLVLQLMGPPGFEDVLASAAAKEVDPSKRPLPHGCYWQYVPYNTFSASPPPSRIYANLHFIGHYIYVGRMWQYLEGNPHARAHNAGMAKRAVFPDQTKALSIEPLHELPMIETQLGIR